MQPHTDQNTNDTPTDWPSLVEFKQSRFPEYDPSTDADAEPDEPAADTVDFVLPD
jgi:hypothetical protein